MNEGVVLLYIRKLFGFVWRTSFLNICVIYCCICAWQLVHNDQECDVLFFQELFVAKSNTQVMHTENKLNVSTAIVFSACVFSFSSVRF